jgi:pilus assembly protein Flp/PilA
MARLIGKIGNPTRILKNSRGQTLIEYGLLLVLIAVVVITAVTLVGERTSTSFSTVSSALPSP